MVFCNKPKRCTEGVTQTNVLRSAEDYFDIKVANIKLDELLAADEMFIASTTAYFAYFEGRQSENRRWSDRKKN